MTTSQWDLPYRPCVGVMLVNGDGKVFVGRRIDNKEGDAWQMPQGGMDDGEDIVTAGLRELAEETGVTEASAALIARSREELLYDLPDELIGRLWGGKYRGQRQKWLLLRFAGEDTDIRIDAHEHPEFNEWRWVEPELLPDLIVPFKKRVYRQIVEEFRELI
ncbi:MAG: RNA pyrophosphohydrolase [Novosphingobium sp. 12-63-9]|nr:MAG: RNA pyrophosphohydrolase [Novosphingobium sp. 12-63-9]